jgi:hypothetical protein
VRLTDSGKEDPQIIVNFSGGRDCRSRVSAGAALLDRNRRRQSLDKIDIWLFHLIEELPRISGETLYVSALPFGIKSVESQRGFPRTTQPGDDHKFFPWNLHMEVLEIVLAGTTNFDDLRRHSDEECRTYQSSTAPLFLQRHWAPTCNQPIDGKDSLFAIPPVRKSNLSKFTRSLSGTPKPSLNAPVDASSRAK